MSCRASHSLLNHPTRCPGRFSACNGPLLLNCPIHDDRCFVLALIEPDRHCRNGRCRIPANETSQRDILSSITVLRRGNYCIGQAMYFAHHKARLLQVSNHHQLKPTPSLLIANLLTSLLSYLNLKPFYSRFIAMQLSAVLSLVALFASGRNDLPPPSRTGLTDGSVFLP